MPDIFPAPWEDEPLVTDAERRSISNIESGGSYQRLGPVTRSGDRAYGKYQVMGANIPEWTQAAIGRPLNPTQFLADPNAQEAVFENRFGQYKQKYGAEGAARAWFAGEGGMNNLSGRDMLGTGVGEYGRRFTAGLRGAAESPRPPFTPSPVLPAPWEQAEPAPAAGPAPTPEEPAPLASQQAEAPPGPRLTTAEAFGRGVEKTKGMLGAAAEIAGEVAGAEPLQRYGKGVREAAQEEIKKYPAGQEFLKIRSVFDAGQFAKETIADFVPQIGLTLGGAATGGLVGGPVGALIGGAIPSIPLNIGDIQSQLKQEAPDVSAPGYVAAGGLAAAALDSITPLRLGSKIITKFGAEIGEDVARRTLEILAGKEATKGIVRGTAEEVVKSAGVEGLTEAAQEAIGEFAVSGALDRSP